MTVLETYKKEFRDILPSLRGGQNIARARKGSMERFAFLGGIPEARDEDWRYSDLEAIRSEHLAHPKLPPAQTVPRFGPLTRWPALAIMNGKILGSTPYLEGVKIIGADQALGRFPKWANDYLQPGLEESPLERLNLAMTEGGVFIHVAKNMVLEGLEIVFLESGDKEDAHHLRNFIHLESGAKAQILIRTVAQEKNPGWTNMVSNFFLGENAHLTLACDYDQKETSFFTGRNFVKVRKGASFTQTSLALGLTTHRLETEVDLLGEGADANLTAGLLATDGEVIDFVSRVHHTSPKATSNQMVKAVADKGGQTAFQGRVVVEVNAQQTEAHQTCNNLILEPTGEANVKPELLIFADDVVCSHGATIGQLDEAALFYMLQRGIPEAEAKGLLVQAFLGDVVESLKDEVLKTYFEDKIEDWMLKNLGRHTR